MVSIAEHDRDGVRLAVLDDGNGARVDADAVQRGLGDAAAPPIRVRDGDVVARLAKPPRNRELGPG